MCKLCGSWIQNIIETLIFVNKCAEERLEVRRQITEGRNQKEQGRGHKPEFCEHKTNKKGRWQIKIATCL